MKRVLLLIARAFLIAGGTVGILYQEGIGGVKKEEAQTPTVSEEQLATQEDVSAAEAEEEDIEDSYTQEEKDALAQSLPSAQANADSVTDPDIAALSDAETTEDELAEADAAEKEAEAAAAEVAAQAEEEKKAAEEEARKEKEEKGPFYSITVLGINGGLTMHKNPTGDGDSLGVVAKGTKGYMIGSSSAGKNRRLCYIDGKICYLSKNYTEFTEIPADEYPDALLNVTEADAGSDFSLE